MLDTPLMLWELSVTEQRYRAVLEAGSMAGSGGTGRPSVFVRYEELTGRSFQVFYDDDDPDRVLREDQGAPRSRARTQGRPDGRGLALAPARHGRCPRVLGCGSPGGVLRFAAGLPVNLVPAAGTSGAFEVSRCANS
jgi:hypothetical protein